MEYIVHIVKRCPPNHGDYAFGTICFGSGSALIFSLDPDPHLLFSLENLESVLFIIHSCFCFINLKLVGR